ncbi:DnaJ subfamily A member 1 isoform 1 [Schistosoma japonicum]|uniref:DnaJ subfamily A member 1 isoform 1 n=1 Tax=Schistosoma japonicum TaxID=6182 RepID=Q5DDN7_SCHJA|nr:SJCHGC06648 protein [Schistosoma japonicum]TNN15278.1 DnaJ subfamily A member 1 isoform 1 [Schistosoma japonicum]TNN15279.1 DnaJ subfamily A member 1 isoform 1 [Schistosoma japonicum]TNN15281.1 DnaJ subfamily A member 1 isoform 1 [Schistosoma japonicum]TNN15282.1 DnaJ subfamily A member 1 isoform 1 [Schistosoma japonicum]
MIRKLYRRNSFLLLCNLCRPVSSQTHYDTLGVKKSATYSEIRSAFIELSKKYHPDKNHDDTETFKKINEAYSVLSQEKSRLIYDASLISNPKSSYDKSQNKDGSSAWEGDYIFSQRGMHFRQNTHNTKENPKMSQLFLFLTALAFSTYFISLYTFIQKRNSRFYNQLYERQFVEWTQNHNSRLTGEEMPYKQDSKG